MSIDQRVLISLGYAVTMYTVIVNSKEQSQCL